MRIRWSIGALVLFALALLFPAAKAVGQYSVVTSVLDGTTFIVPANTTSNYTTVVFDTRKQKDLMLESSFKSTGANTSTITFTLQPSLDGVTFDTIKVWTWTVTATGTSTAVGTTNIATGGAGFVRLASIQNANATQGLTNILVRSAVKKID